MPNKTTKSHKSIPPKKITSPGQKILLTLSLVPLIIGMILLGAWVLDIEILSEPQAQITVAIFFFLLAFTTSNALQRRWRLALGWGLLAVADIISLAWLNVAVQVAALTSGFIGLILLGIEFYRQYQQGKQKNRE
jgi:uncharacterized membrane protein